MWTQRETGRRWPFARMRDRASAPDADTVGLLDSVSRTASYTGPAPLEAPPSTAWELLANVTAQAPADPAAASTGEPRVRTGEDRVVAGHDRVSTWEDPPRIWERVPLRKLAIGGASFVLLIGALAAGLTMATSAGPRPTCAWGQPRVDRLDARQGVLHLARATSTPDPDTASGRGVSADVGARSVRLRAVLVAPRGISNPGGRLLHHRLLRRRREPQRHHSDPSRAGTVTRARTSPTS